MLTIFDSELVERAKNGTLIRLGYMMELEGNHKPALIAELLMLADD